MFFPFKNVDTRSSNIVFATFVSYDGSEFKPKSYKLIVIATIMDNDSRDKGIYLFCRQYIMYE